MNNNYDNTASQETVTNIRDGVTYLDDRLTPITYDTELVETFLDTVFHAGVDTEEHICCYYDAKSQGYPIEEQAFFTKLDRTHKPAKLYFGCGTVSKDPERGIILNRNARFVSYRVLVLDDIGSKVSLAKIPEDFKPTYIIESSPNNFQYGYVLEEPLTDLDQARALVELVYGGGFSDSGGKLVMKKVRLPEGINGKLDKEYGEFRVKLHHMDGPRWTPEAILKTLGVGTDWAHVVEDAMESRRRNTAVTGTSLWSPLHAHNASLDGIIDPVMEWLVDNNTVVNFDHDWAEIVCPWAIEHTDGKTSAYYSPVGFGEGDHASMRTFNCFHSHGDTTKTNDFLSYVAENGGPECAQYDPAAALVASHVYDATNNTVWGIKGLFPRAYKGLDAFKNTHNSSVRKPTLTPKNKIEFKNVPLSTLFMHSPARVVVDGTTFDPRTPARIVKQDDHLKLNTFSPPAWGDGRYDADIVQVFKDYLEYLIPDETERGMFTEWIAAKVQNMGFRGWGMMMVAKDHGTGRGTLAMMLSRLFDPRNCADKSFSELLNPQDGFNEWQSKLLVISNEASDTSNSKGFYNQCTQLRELIDTTPKLVEVNNKYGAKETRLLCTSHLIFTNYENGSALDDDDRRMYVMSNADHPASGDYFTKINEWADKIDKEGRYVFVNEVARWLKTVPVDLTKMNGRAPTTRSKTDMIEASKSAIDIFVRAFIEALPTPYSTVQMMHELSLKFFSRIDEPSVKLVRILYSSMTDSMHDKTVFKRDSKTVRVRITHKHSFEGYVDTANKLKREQIKADSPANKRIRRSVIDALHFTDLTKVAQHIEQKLDEAGY